MGGSMRHDTSPPSPSSLLSLILVSTCLFSQKQKLQSLLKNTNKCPEVGFIHTLYKENLPLGSVFPTKRTCESMTMCICMRKPVWITCMCMHIYKVEIMTCTVLCFIFHLFSCDIRFPWHLIWETPFLRKEVYIIVLYLIVFPLMNAYACPAWFAVMNSTDMRLHVLMSVCLSAQPSSLFLCCLKSRLESKPLPLLLIQGHQYVLQLVTHWCW